MRPLNQSLIFLSLLIALGCQAESSISSSGGGEPGAYKTFKARNGVEIPYRVLLPETFDHTKSYPAVVAFSNMTYDPSLGDDLIGRMWGENAFKEYILIVPLAPKTGRYGWMNHPAHHALEDLLDDIKDQYEIAGGQFYNFGYRDGTIPALSWMHMSFRYFNSLVLASCFTLDEKGMKDAQKMSSWNKRIVLITGAQDQSGMSQEASFRSSLPALEPELVSIISEEDNRSLNHFFESAFKQFITEHLSDRSL